jgi:hypothetical protein
VRKLYWQQALIYPPHDDAPLALTERLIAMLRLFAVDPAATSAPAQTR